ncbi:MAG: LicD family protein [Gammaproteobacteria bacterium]|nr:LicD family protein [Gammaproteobacteria bacterium]
MKKIKRSLKRRLGLPSGRPPFTGKHYRRGRTLLLDTVDIFNAAGIPYTLDAGTLLGIVRDGDLIPWDNDIDLMLPASAVPQLRRVYRQIFLRGWKVSRTYRMTFASDAWRVGDPRVVKLRSWNPWLFGPGSTLLDITIIHPHQGAYWWEMAKQVCRADAGYFEQESWLQWGGRRIRVPHDYEAYLGELYGDWRTPDAKFHHDQFGTIVR